jgi:hypothetical protein
MYSFLFKVSLAAALQQASRPCKAARWVASVSAGLVALVKVRARDGLLDVRFRAFRRREVERDERHCSNLGVARFFFF